MKQISSWHPIVSMVYFLSVMLIIMFSVNPLLMMIGFLGSILLFIMLEGYGRFLKELKFYLLLFVLVTLINPLFSHDGVTTLFYLNGNPVTLEALLYGIYIALMLVAVMYWFKCFNVVITNDKLLYLIGGVSPKISLIISSALRFIPLLKEQAGKIRQSQKAMGLFTSDAWTDKLAGTARVYSSLITWALEYAIDTGASMKGRGYGLKGRSRYSIFRMTGADIINLIVIVILDVVIIGFMATGKLNFTFYPEISAVASAEGSIYAFAAFALLSFLPVILEVKESVLWIYCKSKI